MKKCVESFCENIVVLARNRKCILGFGTPKSTGSQRGHLDRSLIGWPNDEEILLTDLRLRVRNLLAQNTNGLNLDF